MDYALLNISVFYFCRISTRKPYLFWFYFQIQLRQFEIRKNWCNAISSSRFQVSCAIKTGFIHFLSWVFRHFYAFVSHRKLIAISVWAWSWQIVCIANKEQTDKRSSPQLNDCTYCVRSAFTYFRLRRKSHLTASQCVPKCACSIDIFVDLQPFSWNLKWGLFGHPVCGVLGTWRSGIGPFANLPTGSY